MKILLVMASVVFVLMACGGDSEGHPLLWNKFTDSNRYEC